MVPHRHPKPVSVARQKAVAVREGIRQAQADLHDANEMLADTVVGTIVTEESVEAALLQNLQVESELHDAVKELQVVTELLRVAEEEKAHDHAEVAEAGRRSGEGLTSVLEQMGTQARRRS